MSIYQVTVVQGLLNQTLNNVFYFDTVAGDPTSAEWQTIADEIATTVLNTQQLRCTPSWSAIGIRYRRVDTAGLPSFTKTFTAGPVVGTAAGDDLPTQVSLLVSIKSNTLKPNKARTYHGGLSENETTAGLWNAATLNSLEGYAINMEQLNTAGTNPLDRVSAQWNATRTFVVAFNSLVGGTVTASTVPATQRRRRIGIGI